MPATDIKKVFLPNATYHIYNRGAFKKDVYKDKNDFEYFYTLLLQEQKAHAIQINVECLIPNHLHLQVSQKNPYDMTSFMRSLMTRYCMYFCNKYNHSGHVFQGIYKASLLLGEKRIQENTLYILKNPINAGYDYWPYVGRFWKWREKFL